MKCLYCNLERVDLGLGDKCLEHYHLRKRFKYAEFIDLVSKGYTFAQTRRVCRRRNEHYFDWLKRQKEDEEVRNYIKGCKLMKKKSLTAEELADLIDCLGLQSYTQELRNKTISLLELDKKTQPPIVEVDITTC
jgi:hypothetical protein